MNEQTSKFLEQLAQKLGTTTEYLWSVLIKQAPIDAWISLFQITLIVLFGVYLFKKHKALSVEVKSDYGRECGYDKYGATAVIPMIIGGLFFVIFGIAAFFCINDVVNGFFNPEYWAMERIFLACRN